MDKLIEEIEALYQKATKGEWFWDGINYIFSATPENNQMICEMRGVGAKLPIEDNANLIVALVNTWPLIKKHVEASGRAKEALRKMEVPDNQILITTEPDVSSSDLMRQEIGKFARNIAITTSTGWRSQRDEILSSWESEEKGE